MATCVPGSLPDGVDIAEISFASSGEPVVFSPVPTNSGDVTAVDEWEAILAEGEELSPAAVDRIIEVHGDRGQRAIEAVGEGRVKEYRDFTVVVGIEDEYVVEGDSCECADATYNLERGDPVQLCWHAIAARIAHAIDAAEEHDMWYSDVTEFL